MKRRWNANTWVLAILGGLLLLTAVDIGRRYVMPSAGASDQAPPDPAKAAQPGFKVGDAAPDFSLPDKDGKKQQFASLVKGDTLLFFLCGCTNCRATQKYTAGLEKKMGAKAPAVIGVSSQKPDFEKRYQEITGLKQTLLYEQPDNKVMDLYKGHPCPRVYRIDGQRRVTWISSSMNQFAPEIAWQKIQLEIANELGFATENYPRVGAPPAPPVEAPEGAAPPAPRFRQLPDVAAPAKPAPIQPVEVPALPGNRPSRFR